MDGLGLTPSKAGLIKVVRRAVFKITDEGLKVIKDPTITRIDSKFLSNRYKSFNEFINKTSNEKEI